METRKLKVTRTEVLNEILGVLERDVSKATSIGETASEFERGVANGQLAQAYKVISQIERTQKSNPLIFALKLNIQNYMLQALTNTSTEHRTIELN